MPIRETKERTVITITTNSQTTDREENSTAVDEATEADQVTDIRAPLPTVSPSRILTAGTPMPTSNIGCRNAISTRSNGRNPTATTTRPSDARELPEGGKLHGSGEVG